MRMFHKILRFPIIRSSYYKLGDLLNLIQVDVLQAAQYYYSLVQMIGLPIFILVGLVMNLNIVGTKSIVGFAVSIAQMLINVIFGYVYGSY
jgi:ABC-type transport system involved in cytochrome bd biosynthesis fused ATPase/permease subunit